MNQERQLVKISETKEKRENMLSQKPREENILTTTTTKKGFSAEPNTTTRVGKTVTEWHPIW